GRRRDDEGLMAEIMKQYPAHKARVEQFHAQGKVLMIGTFADPLKDGSMGVWRTREDIEEFMAGDPFVTNGLLRSWRILEWNESLFS
ncbi:MAG TPA: YciI family protein, partial [Dehalococcoidia bacterium]